MSTPEIVLVSVLICAVAAVYSCVGHAGASSYLAVMALIGVQPPAMKPAALILNIFVAAIAAVRFYGAGCFSWTLLWPFVITSVPAALIGGLITLPGTMYRPILGIMLLVAAYRLFSPPRAAANVSLRAPPVAAALALGTVIGLVSGLIGVGGGILLSPILILARWADPRRTAGVSAAFILANSVSGLAGQLAAHQHLPILVVPWVVAAAAGGVLGSGLGSRRLGAQMLRRVLATVLIIASIKFILI